MARSNSNDYEEAAQQRVIDADCHSFYEIGFSRDIFKVKNLKGHGYDLNKLINIIDPIYKIKDLDVMHSLFDSCWVDKYCFQSFIRRINWLKTDVDSGKPLLEKALATIAKPIDETHIGLARNLIEFGASRKLVQKDAIDQLEKIRIRQNELAKKASLIKQDLEVVLGPLYGFEEISIEKLRINAYNLYENDCMSKGITPIPITHSKGFKTAIDMFGDTVKDNHFLDFVNQPLKKMEIENHFEKGILMLNEKGDLVINSDDGEKSGNM